VLFVARASQGGTGLAEGDWKVELMSKQAVELAKKLAELLASAEQPANDDEPIDEDALRERARQAAERMRKARNR
jgi:hypothetical protein